MCYNRSMSTVIHRKDSDVRHHLTFNKNSAQTLRPKVLYAGELKRTKTWNEQPHSHKFCEILYVRSGEGIVYIDEETLEIKPGDLLVFNPQVMHYESGKELSLYFMGVTRIRLDGMEEDYLLENNVSPVLHAGSSALVIESLFEQLITEAERKLYYYDEISDSLVKIIINHILRILAYGDRSYFRTNDSYAQAKKYIDENYANIKTVDDVCRSMYISRYYLSHLFKEYSGMSPLKYIIIKRMEYAKELLRTTDLPICEIALKTGYVELNSFTKIFKKLENMTPYAYRVQSKKSGS